MAKRAVVRRRLADITSTSKLKIARRFFSDLPLADGSSSDYFLQPAEKRRPPGADVFVGWVARWLFDLKWADENIEYELLIRADDDGFQCGAAALADLFGHLPKAGPLMVFSSENAPMHKALLSMGRVPLYRWPWAEKDEWLDFDENWVLLSKPMARSILDVVAVKLPGVRQMLPAYLQSLYMSHHWPPSKSFIADVGRFDNDTNYPACIGPPSDTCTQG
eukprot:CAMPEP_0117619202 /NCGR_PEP_ID=MMETSP0784-20121206/86496_1 /TAXON_ID=39447 /ORGANISM="" /LENGTH=219 /DNA_ID=CAMNT_0005423087 /DNA_START=236 /DNA_END=892 /DNA_ORIENTATION=-